MPPLSFTTHKECAEFWEAISPQPQTNWQTASGGAEFYIFIGICQPSVWLPALSLFKIMNLKRQHHTCEQCSLSASRKLFSAENNLIRCINLLASGEGILIQPVFQNYSPSLWLAEFSLSLAAYPEYNQVKLLENSSLVLDSKNNEII